MAGLAQVQMVPREVMDIRQAADYLGISSDTLYRYASEGFVPAFKLGNRWRFKRSLLDAWMVEQSGGNASGKVSVMQKQKKPMGRARKGLPHPLVFLQNIQNVGLMGGPPDKLLILMELFCKILKTKENGPERNAFGAVLLS